MLRLADLQPPDDEPETVRELADRILARPEFGDDRTLLERARDWVFDRINDLFESVFAAGGGGLLGWAVVFGLTVAAVFFAWRFSRGVRRDPGLAGIGPEAPGRPATAWLAKAEVAEGNGEWREGLRCRYRALVADLARRGLVEEVPGRTAGEYRRQAADSAPATAEPMGAATALFETAWYGNRPTGAEEAARFADLARQVAARRDLVGARS